MVYGIISSKNSIVIFSKLIAWLGISTILKFSPGTTSFFTIIELFAIVLVFFRERVDVFFIMIWGGLVLYFFAGITNEYLLLIKISIIPLIVYFICSRLRQARDVCFIKESTDQLFICYLSGFAFQTILALLIDYIPNLSSFVAYKNANLDNIEYVSRFSGLLTDPNYYAVGLLLNASICLFYLAVSKKHRVVLISFILFLLYLGALTGSKMFVFIFAFNIFFFLFYLAKNKKIHYIFLIIIACALFYYVATDFINNVIRLTTYRFSSEKIDLSTGRVDIWESYFFDSSLSFVDLMFGHGIESLDPFLHASTSMHNYYLETFYILGVIGCIIYVYVMLYATHIWNKDTKLHVSFSVFPLFTLLLSFFALSFFYQMEFPFQLSLSVLMLYYPVSNTDHLGRESNE